MREFIKVFAIAMLGGMIVLGGQQAIGFFDNGIGSFKETNDRLDDDAFNQGVNYQNVSNNGALNLPNFKEAAKKTVHAVVYIQTEFTSKSSVYDDYFSLDDFFGRRNPSLLKASGSGVIISSDGYIVTNNHVVQEADKISITLNDKRTYTAKLIGTDPSTDLALLKIEAENLQFVTFGNSDEIQVGDWVLAVGNPFNLTSTVTAGIISAKARNINILGSNSAIESFLQTDAVVNPGNSGGALVDIDGELVGINAAIASRTGSYIGYSFAIPVGIVKKVVTDLKEFGIVQRAYIGVTIKEVDDKKAKSMQLDSIKGVYVESVTEDGSADEAGIENGAVILSVNGFPVNSTSELLERIGAHRPGDKVSMQVVQNKKEKEYTLVLTNRFGNTKLEQIENKPAVAKIGASFQDVPVSIQNSLGIDFGQQIVSIDNGVLKTAGIRQGFIILKIGSTIIHTEKDIIDALESKTGGVLIEGIYPNGVRAYYGIGL